MTQPEGSGPKRGQCESCGMWISIAGGYELSGLPGIYCNRFCLEQGIFYHDDPHRKGSEAAQIGTGRFLQEYIAKLESDDSNESGRCFYCSGTMLTCRRKAKYCSASCRQMAYRRSRIGKNPSKKPIKQGYYPSTIHACGTTGPIIQ